MQPQVQQEDTVSARQGDLVKGLVGAFLAVALLSGCYALKNHPLDPSQVGDFSYEATFDIRSTLSLQDTPSGIPGATDPRREDLAATKAVYRFSPGDGVQIRILELLSSGSETPSQVSIDENGDVSLPVLGRMNIAGLTPAELETQIKDKLAEMEVLNDAQVIVEPLVRRKWTYSIYGAVAAPNVYPITTPDLKVVEALNVAGGLADAAEEVYVFRSHPEFSESTGTAPVGPAVLSEPEAGDGAVSAGVQGIHLSDGMESSRTLVLHARANRDTKDLAREIAAARRRQDPPAEPPKAEEQVEQSEAGPETTSPPTSEDLQPGMPDSGYIFYNHEWIPAGPGEGEQAPPEGEEAPGAPESAAQEAPTGMDWEALAGEEPETRIIRLSAEKLRNGDPRENIVVRPGDVIRTFAGEIGEYFMMGQVARPGAYSLTGRQVTLMQAVAAAGGLGPLAWPTRCTIYRRYGDRREMKQLDLDRMFAGRDPDVTLKKDDIVLIGTHPAAPFLLVLRNSFRMTYGFGFVYDRNFADIDAFAARQNPETIEQFQPRFDGIFN